MGFAANANAGMLVDLYAGGTFGSGGMTVFNDKDKISDTSTSYGAVFGIDIPVVRVEAEYNYLNGKDVNMSLGMLNAYLKMPATVIKPYLGVGVGTAFGGKYADTIDIDTTAAYQGMLGITFDLPQLPVKFDVEGRAVYVPDIIEVMTIKPDMLNYDLRLKVRYVF